MVVIERELRGKMTGQRRRSGFGMSGRCWASLQSVRCCVSTHETITDRQYKANCSPKSSFVPTLQIALWVDRNIFVG